jgi:hypothetical protein
MNEQEKNRPNEQKWERTAEQILEDNGYDAEDIVLLKDESYDSALIAVTDDFRAVYSYDKMVEWYMNKNGCSAEEAIEWIDYNTLRAIPYAGARAPIVVKELE